METNLFELTVSNDVQDNAAELQNRLDQDGYLFFRKLLNPERLIELRRQMLTVMQAGGWLVEGSDPLEGIANVSARCTEGDPGYTDVYHEVYKIELFHEMAHSPELMKVLETIRGTSMMPLPQKVARLWFPKFTAHTTPTHQDYVHFQGSFDNLTCWSPIGDCPRELGGLAVLEGSHKVAKVLDHQFSLGAGSLNVDASNYSELTSERWLTTDYQAGDTLIFPALTIHKALPNVTEDRLRVSLDNRYQRIGDPTAEHMLTPHLSTMNPIGWDEIYHDWTNEDLKYYWKRHSNPVIPKVTSFMEDAFEEAVRLAKSGDDHAKLHLERISQRDPSSENGQIATAVLASL